MNSCVCFHECRSLNLSYYWKVGPWGQVISLKIPSAKPFLSMPISSYVRVEICALHQLSHSRWMLYYYSCQWFLEHSNKYFLLYSHSLSLVVCFSFINILVLACSSQELQTKCLCRETATRLMCIAKERGFHPITLGNNCSFILKRNLQSKPKDIFSVTGIKIQYFAYWFLTLFTVVSF